MITILKKTCRFCNNKIVGKPFTVNVQTADGIQKYKCCADCAATLTEISKLIKSGNSDDSI